MHSKSTSPKFPKPIIESANTIDSIFDNLHKVFMTFHSDVKTTLHGQTQARKEFRVLRRQLLKTNSRKIQKGIVQKLRTIEQSQRKVSLNFKRFYKLVNANIRAMTKSVNILKRRTHKLDVELKPEFDKLIQTLEARFEKLVNETNQIGDEVDEFVAKASGKEAIPPVECESMLRECLNKCPKKFVYDSIQECRNACEVLYLACNAIWDTSQILKKDTIEAVDFMRDAAIRIIGVSNSLRLI